VEVVAEPGEAGLEAGEELVEEVGDQVGDRRGGLRGHFCLDFLGSFGYFVLDRWDWWIFILSLTRSNGSRSGRIESGKEKCCSAEDRIIAAALRGSFGKVSFSVLN